MPRILPEHTSAIVDASLWETPSLFKIIQNKGKIEINEMYRVYNMGIGMILVCDKKYVSKINSLLKDSFIIGEVCDKKNNHLIEIINQ